MLALVTMIIPTCITAVKELKYFFSELVIAIVLKDKATSAKERPRK